MEAKINNSEEQIRIRRAQSTLAIVGTGIIMFGAWVALKVYSIVLLRESKTLEELRSYVPEDADPMSDRLLLFTLLAIITIYVAIELGVRMYIGKSAIAESRGKKKSVMYIVLTFILILLALISVMFDGAGLIQKVIGTESGVENTTQTDMLTAFIIDLTSLIMMIEMVVCAFRVRKHKKQQRQAEVDHAA